MIRHPPILVRLARGVIAVILALAPIGLGSAPTAYAAHTNSSVATQKAIAALTKKVLALIRGMPADTPQSTFEGLILGATSGKPCPIVKAALAAVAATDGIPPAAAAAATAVSSYCGAATGALGHNNLGNTPGFSPGGNGSNYQ